MGQDVVFLLESRQMLLRILKIYVFVYNPPSNIFARCVYNVFLLFMVDFFCMYSFLCLYVFVLCIVRFVRKSCVLTTGWFGEIGVIQKQITPRSTSPSLSTEPYSFWFGFLHESAKPWFRPGNSRYFKFYGDRPRNESHTLKNQYVSIIPIYHVYNYVTPIPFSLFVLWGDGSMWSRVHM